MIDVVFDDSHKGCLKEMGSLAKQASIDVHKLYQIGFQLDIGTIENAEDAARSDVMEKLWDIFEMPLDEYTYYQTALQEDLKAFLTQARKKEPIRIWTSSAPHETCGFYYTCYLVQEMNCPVSIVSLPTFISYDHETMAAYESWNHVDIKTHLALLPSMRCLSKQEIAIYADRWNVLMKENAALRVNMNGKLISADEDFYDSIIKRHIPDGIFLSAYLIGQLLGSDLSGISDSFLALRIEHMIQDGYLEIVKPAGEHPYSALLQKCIAKGDLN